MPTVLAENLTKDYRVADKQPGMMGTLRHFFYRNYRTIHAVKNVNFQIDSGEIVGFLGPNGAGKTTTLKMLTGLIHPTSGTLQVAGFNPWQRKTDFLRKITLVMGQKQQLLWDLPAMESLRVNAAIFEIDRKTFKQRIGMLSDMLGLDKELNQPIRKLSLGQRMKAEFLAALMHQPEVLFLDEPTLGLDINAQGAIRSFLRDYNEQYKATILMSSHYMIDITALCERVLLIHNGEMRHDGPLTSLTENLVPHREITLEFESVVTPSQLQPYASEITLDHTTATLLVERDQIAHIVEQLLTNFKVVDLKITDPPIDNIIARLYRDGIQDNQATDTPHQPSTNTSNADPQQHPEDSHTIEEEQPL